MEEISWMRFIFGFAFVLGLIALFAYSLKRWGGLLPQARPAKDARLKVVETCYIDARHRLVLVKRDGVEHLVLIGPERQTLIESGIHEKS